MFIKSQAKLIYVGQGVADNGSPFTLEIVKDNIRVDEMQTFSSNYYNDQQRNMRLSRNLVVPTYLTFDIFEDNKRYELMYVEYDNLKYKIKHILKFKPNRYSRGNTRQKMILDIEELR